MAMSRSPFWTQLCRIRIAEEVGGAQDHQLITVVTGGGGGVGGVGPKRFNTRSLSPRFCLTVVVTVAFVVGIVIGILLPISPGPNSFSSPPLLLPLLSHYDKKSEGGGSMVTIDPYTVTPSTTPASSSGSLLYASIQQRAFHNAPLTNRSSSNQSDDVTDVLSSSRRRNNAEDDEILRTFGDVMTRYRWWPLSVESEPWKISELPPRANQRTLAAAATISTPLQQQQEQQKPVNVSNKRQIVLNTATTPNPFTANNLKVESERPEMVVTANGRRSGPHEKDEEKGGATSMTIDPNLSSNSEGQQQQQTAQMTRPILGQHFTDNNNVSLEDNMNVSSLVSDGVFWSPAVEAALPLGFAVEDNWRWTMFADQVPVVKVLEGCGRMQNRLLVFENGTKACCRYRQNNDQIQGEIFSFYLAHLLGLRNLPPATLGLLFGREWQWRSVRGQLTLAQWNEQKPVVMTKFVDDLVPAYIPRHFRGVEEEERRRLHPVEEDLAGLSREQITELAQWSDLVIFDYLTANLDRVVNNMYNKQWNPDMMDAPAHNLAKVAQTGLLVFLDNESGLLHGYRLLDKYESYHRATLEALCVFRRSTVQAVRALRGANDAEQVGRRLKEALRSSQPRMMDWLPLLPEKSVKILRERLSRVEQQVRDCEKRFGYGYADDLVETLTKPSPMTNA